MVKFEIQKQTNLKSSIIERAEHGDATLDPVRLGLFGGHSDHQHEISRVTCCHQGSTTLTCLVNGAIVVHVVLDFSLEARLEPDHRSFDEEDLRVTLIQASPLGVPLASFYKHTIDVDTVFRRSGILFLDNFKIEDQTINGNTVFTGIVLDRTCQETLSEIEPIDPVERWQTLINPGLEELQALLEVSYISTKWLQ